MTPKDFQEYVEIMRSYGIKKLTIKDVTILMDQLPPQKKEKEPFPFFGMPVQGPTPLTPKQEQILHEKMEKAKSVVTMDDEQLISALFPEPKSEAV